MWDQVTFHRLRCAGDGCHRVSEPRQTMAAALVFARAGMLWRQLPDGRLICPGCATILECCEARSVSASQGKLS